MGIWHCGGKRLFTKSWTVFSQWIDAGRGGQRNFRNGNALAVSISPVQRHLQANRSKESSTDDHRSAVEEDDDHSHERLDLSEEEHSKLPSHGFTNDHFISLSPIQKAVIFFGSGLHAFLDPTKAG